MSIRWITPLLGTAPAMAVRPEDGVEIVDVRELVDKPGNRADAVREKIEQGRALLASGKKTVVCCDYGISRSNSVAVGILSVFENIPFEVAVRRVLEATGEKEIKSAPLQAVRAALQAGQPQKLKDKKTILITGGSGFLGQPVARRLAEKYKVVSPIRADLDLRLGSTQLDLLAGEHDADCIVHLANPRIYTSNVAMGDTLTMLRNAMDVCVARDIRLVYLSSWEVYSGYRTAGLRADESLPLLPKGPYAETKYLAEMLVEHARRTQGLKCLMMRSSPGYGAGSDKPKFIYNFIGKIKAGQPVVTHRYNNALPALDLMHIDDIVDGVVRAAESDYCGNLNIGTGVLTPIRDVAQMLMHLLGKTGEVGTTPIDGDTACIAMDAARAYDVLGWEATVALEQGLSDIVKKQA